MEEVEPLVSSDKESTPVNGTVTALIAMDGSEYSDYALQFYSEKLHKPGNKTVIAHTTEYRCITGPGVPMMTGDFNTTMVTKEIKGIEQKASEIVLKIKHRTEELGIEAKIERIHGEPGPAIVTLSNQIHANYIVVGCRGKGQIRKTITGSVTDFITHHSHVPVVVARHKDHLKKLQLRIPFRRQRSRGDPTSASSTGSSTPQNSPSSSSSAGSPFKFKSPFSFGSKGPTKAT